MNPAALFVLYMLQGVPAALLEGYMPQVLKAIDAPLSMFGWTGVMFLPFNFRFVFAQFYSRAKIQPAIGIPVLLAVIALAFLCCLSFPVSALRADAQRSNSNVGPVFALLGLMMLCVAAADPLMDLLVFRSGKFSNSLQAVAWKAGKSVGGFLVSLLLVRFDLGWSLVVGLLAVLYFGAALSSSRIKCYEDKPSQSVESPAQTDTSWPSTSVTFLLLLVIALTNKLGETLVKRTWVPFFVDMTREAIGVQVQVGSPADRSGDALVSRLVSGEGDEGAFLSLLGSLCVVFTPKGQELRAFCFACLLRVAALLWLCTIVASGRACFIEVEVEVSGPWAFDLHWRLAKGLYELQTGMTAGLFSLLAFAVMRQSSELEANFLTLYALLESADSWAKSGGNLVAGWVASQVGHLFGVLLCAAVASLIPLAAAGVLSRMKLLTNKNKKSLD
jgi:hypothetical protein